MTDELSQEDFCQEIQRLRQHLQAAEINFFQAPDRNAVLTVHHQVGLCSVTAIGLSHADSMILSDSMCFSGIV